MSELHPVGTRGWIFEFLQKGELLTGLAVTVPANGPHDLPTVIPNPSPGVKAHIHVPSPAFPFVAREVRSIEALLSVFGVHKIDLNHFTTTWIPENDEEKAAIKVRKFSTDLGKPDLTHAPPLPFDLLARSVFAADEAAEIEMQLAFFRKGSLDCYEHRFIDGIFNFYFLLESLFGAGKYKKQTVKQAFKSSKQLRKAIQKALSDPIVTKSTLQNESCNFIKKFGAMSVDSIIEYIVDLRGFLHHHTGKRKDIWHPEDHKRYQLDAFLLQSIAFRVSMEMCLGYFCRPKVLEAYSRAFAPR